MIRFLVMEPIYPSLNPRFDVSVTYLQLIIFSVVADVLVDSNALFNRLYETQDQTGSVFYRCS
jgi:hypothetical protein